MQNLWTLVHGDNGHAVVPMDCNPGSTDQGMLVYQSEEAAQKSAEWQNGMYGLNCHPKRLVELFAPATGLAATGS